MSFPKFGTFNNGLLVNPKPLSGTNTERIALDSSLHDEVASTLRNRRNDQDHPHKFILRNLNNQNSPYNKNIHSFGNLQGRGLPYIMGKMIPTFMEAQKKQMAVPQLCHMSLEKNLIGFRLA